MIDALFRLYSLVMLLRENFDINQIRKHEREIITPMLSRLRVYVSGMYYSFSC